MTKGSAEHIRQHIEDFKAVTEHVIAQMTSSTADVQDGAKLVQNIHTELYKVLDASQVVKKHVDEVAATSTHIRNKADAVNTSIQQTSSITEQILSDAERVSETAQVQDEAVAGLTISVEKMANVMENVTKMLKKYEL